MDINTDKELYEILNKGYFIVDNIFDEEDYKEICYKCKNITHSYGGTSTSYNIPNGLSTNISQGKFCKDISLNNMILSGIEKKIKPLKQSKCHRLHTNCVQKRGNLDYFHIDCNSLDITVLFFLSDNDVNNITINDYNNFGELIIYENEKLIGISPIKNRAVIYYANKFHTGTFTIKNNRYLCVSRYTL